MHLFTTTRRVAPGRAGEALAFAITAAREIATTSGLAVAPWINVYGAPPDTITFAACVRSQTAIGDACSAIQRDDAARLFGATVTDTIGEIVACTGRASVTPAFAAVVTTQCEPGRIADAIAWTVDTSNDIARLTGLRTLVVRELYGPWAMLSRITVAGSLSDLDAAEQRLATDLTYLEHVDECAGWFVPGSVYQRLLRRLGSDIS